MPAAPLDDRDAELLRDLRSRLNRMPPSPSAREVLATAALKSFGRVGLGVGATGVLSELGAAAAELSELRARQPDAFRKAVVDGALQAVLTRRLVLAGREQVASA